MKYTYTIPTNEDGTERTDVILRSDGAWVPTDPANSDYQAYLNPEAAQSTPSLSDEA